MAFKLYLRNFVVFTITWRIIKQYFMKRSPADFLFEITRLIT
jgi:hypothetical protein